MYHIPHLSTSIPAHHTRTIERVALMSTIGSPDMRTKSARFPTSITPRSVNPKYLAGKQVAARNASTFDNPASTKSSNSWCSDSPCGTYKIKQTAKEIFADHRVIIFKWNKTTQSSLYWSHSKICQN